MHKMNPHTCPSEVCSQAKEYSFFMWQFSCGWVLPGSSGMSVSHVENLLACFAQFQGTEARNWKSRVPKEVFDFLTGAYDGCFRNHPEQGFSTLGAYQNLLGSCKNYCSCCPTPSDSELIGLGEVWAVGYLKAPFPKPENHWTEREPLRASCFCGQEAVKTASPTAQVHTPAEHCCVPETPAHLTASLLAFESHFGKSASWAQNINQNLFLLVLKFYIFSP